MSTRKDFSYHPICLTINNLFRGLCHSVNLAGYELVVNISINHFVAILFDGSFHDGPALLIHKVRVHLSSYESRLELYVEVVTPFPFDFTVVM